MFQKFKWWKCWRSCFGLYNSPLRCWVAAERDLETRGYAFFGAVVEVLKKILKKSWRCKKRLYNAPLSLLTQSENGFRNKGLHSFWGRFGGSEDNLERGWRSKKRLYNAPLSLLTRRGRPGSWLVTRSLKIWQSIGVGFWSGWILLRQYRKKMQQKLARWSKKVCGS